jgi:hypothetical protein
MSQQLGILVMVDNEAAVRSGTLRDNIYLVDNGQWAGSSGEATGNLITAIEGTQSAAQMGQQVLNWLPFGIGSPPVMVPQTAFLQAPDRALLADVPHPLRRPQYVQPRILDSLGIEIRNTLTLRDSGERSLLAELDDKTVYYPDPAIVNITGEAVDLGVIFPAQYGSPDLFSEGLYWSASVDTNKIGVFTYTLHIKLSYSKRRKGKVTDLSITLPHDARIKVTKDFAKNGFRDTPAMLPI